MRLSTIVIVLSLPVLWGCAASRAPSPARGAAAVFEVFGMDCPGCHGGLEKNLRKVPGVRAATANWQEQKVTIIFDADEGLDPALVQAAVEASNFTLGERLE